MTSTECCQIRIYIIETIKYEIAEKWSLFRPLPQARYRLCGGPLFLVARGCRLIAGSRFNVSYNSWR